MKNMVARFGIVLIVAAMLVPFTSFAQSAHPIGVNIPFDFFVRERVLPAGAYILKPAWQGSRFWEIRGDKGTAFFNASLALDNKDSYPPRLRFQCYVNECFLSEIHALGDWSVLQGRREVELTKNVRPNTREVAIR